MAMISRYAADLAFAKTEAVHVVVIAVGVVFAMWVACKLIRRRPVAEPAPAGGPGGALVLLAIGVGVWAILSHGATQAGHALRAAKPRPVPVPTRTVIVQRLVAPAHHLLTGTNIVVIVGLALLAVTAWAAITRRGADSDG